MELANAQDRIEYLEEKVAKLQRESDVKEATHREKMEKLRSENRLKSVVPDTETALVHERVKNELSQEVELYKSKCDKLQSELDILKAKPSSDQSSDADYYEKQLGELLEAKRIARSEASSLWVENDALKVRLERLVLEKDALDRILEKSSEELHLTNENYKRQLDAMTEHLAGQNEQIARLSDQVDDLKHKLSLRK